MDSSVTHQCPESLDFDDRVFSSDQTMTDSQRKSLRDAFGAFASGVVVVLASADGETCRGMTANSFTSVSLDPPLLLVSISNSAKWMETVRSSGEFTVNVLKGGQEDISDHFAGSRRSGEPPQIHWTRSGLPVLVDTHARFQCSVDRLVVAGDHTLVLGRVQTFKHEQAHPLLFYRGAYKKLEGTPEYVAS